MRHINTANRLTGFVARKDGWQYKVYAIFFSIVLGLLLIYVYSQSLPLDRVVLFPIALLAFASAYLWFLILDKRVKLVINEVGIKSKKRLVRWDEIRRFYFEGRHYKVTSYFLFIEIIEYGGIIKMNISDLNKSYHQIADAIKTYSNDHQIEYGGINYCDVP